MPWSTTDLFFLIKYVNSQYKNNNNNNNNNKILILGLIQSQYETKTIRQITGSTFASHRGDIAKSTIQQ